MQAGRSAVRQDGRRLRLTLAGVVGRVWLMQDGSTADMQDLRRETPEVRLVQDVAQACVELGEEARRMMQGLPQFGMGLSERGRREELS